MAVPVMLLSAILLTVLLTSINGIRLRGCTSTSNKLTVDETASSVDIVCDQFDVQYTVAWTLQRGNVTNLGTCPPQGNCVQGYRYSLSRSSGQSTVTINPSTESLSNLRFIGSHDIQCSTGTGASQIARCPLDVVYPPEVSGCSVTAKSGTWKVDVSCDITKTFSSRNTYNCQLYRGTTQNTQITQVTGFDYTHTAHSDSNYRQGTCSFNTVFPSLLSNTRQDYYKILIYPGPTSVVKGPVTIEKPVIPNISCPFIVAENSSMTCTCNTTNIGLPGGRLKWSRVNGGTITIGNYGSDSLVTSPQTLTRHDQGKQLFQCDVEWASGSYVAVYTANVGYPPSKTELRVNSATPGPSVNVSEGDDVTLTCTATGGNPVSKLTLSGPSGSTLKSDSSPLTYDINNVQCNMTGVYSCTASNGFGDALTATTTVYVNCQPQGEESVGEINFIDKPVSVTFEVTAHPVPHQVTFAFLGPVNSSSNTNPRTDFKGIMLEGGCVQKERVVYMSVCTVTVNNVTTADAAGIYQVTLTNTQGGENFHLQVKYKAPITDSPQKDPSTGDGPDGAAIGGGIAAALVIIAVIIVIVIVIIKRRKGQSKEKPFSSSAGGAAASRPANGRGMGGYEDVEVLGASADPAQPSPASSLSPLTCQPTPVGDEYAVVNKPKKSAAPAAAASGVEPEATYAVVDKKKKKPAKPDAGDKPKPKKGKEKKAGKEGAGPVYGNVDLKTDKAKKGKKSAPAPPEETSTGREVNQDGLVYTSVDFAGVPQSAAPPKPKPKPDDQTVVYSAVDFIKSAPQ